MASKKTPSPGLPAASTLDALKAQAASLYKLNQDKESLPLKKFSEALQAMIPDLVSTGCIDQVIFGSDTALTFACTRTDLGSIHALLAAGADPKASTKYEQSPLMQVLHGMKHGEPGGISWSKAKPCMEALLAAGADLHHRNQIGQQAIHWGTWDDKEHLEITRWFIAKGANPSAPDDQGITPLHDAAKIGRLSLAQLLLDSGADPFCKADADGKERSADPLAMAMMWFPLHRQLSVVSLLTQVNISSTEKASLNKVIKARKPRKAEGKAAASKPKSI